MAEAQPVEEPMSFVDKVKNKLDETVGKAKEHTGRISNDRSLEYEGKGDQVKANVKQAGEYLKDGVRRVKGVFTK
jgi:uncharacterized protein YjbJ (UPF0337 family)